MDEKEKENNDSLKRLDNLAEFFKLNKVLPKESVCDCASYIVSMSISNNIPAEEYSQLLVMMNRLYLEGMNETKDG